MSFSVPLVRRTIPPVYPSRTIRSSCIMSISNIYTILIKKEKDKKNVPAITAHAPCSTIMPAKWAEQRAEGRGRGRVRLSPRQLSVTAKPRERVLCVSRETSVLFYLISRCFIAQTRLRAIAERSIVTLQRGNSSCKRNEAAHCEGMRVVPYAPSLQVRSIRLRAEH